MICGRFGIIENKTSILAISENESANQYYA